MREIADERGDPNGGIRSVFEIRNTLESPQADGVKKQGMGQAERDKKWVCIPQSADIFT